MNNLFTNNIKTIEFDALIIGGGGSGMRASLELAKSGLKTAVVSKVFFRGKELDVYDHLDNRGKSSTVEIYRKNKPTIS